MGLMARTYHFLPPSKVKHIELRAFSGCKELRDIYCDVSNIEHFDTLAFADINATIYIPYGTWKTYQDKGFARFYGRFKEINGSMEEYKAYLIEREKERKEKLAKAAEKYYKALEEKKNRKTRKKNCRRKKEANGRKK